MEIYSQQPDVKEIAHHNGEGDVRDDIPGGENGGSTSRYPSADAIQYIITRRYKDNERS